MQRKIITTADGSKTIHIPEWNEQYHSKHGAIQEALHVFIKSGLHHVINKGHAELACTERNRSEASQQNISILEIGFGTGLNAYLTLLKSEEQNININYVGVEAFPVTSEEIQQLEYPKAVIKKNQDELFQSLHSVEWGTKHQISKRFSLIKRKQFFDEIEDLEAFNLIYFDAFGPRVQPDLWTEAIFKKMYNALKVNGVLVTYSAKGSVRRAMQTVGFRVERLEGPPGKREMLRAFKAV